MCVLGLGGAGVIKHGQIRLLRFILIVCEEITGGKAELML